jgi:hypothetical protein
VTPEEREAVRELIATLPRCAAYTSGFDGDRCGRPATRAEFDHSDYERYCDEHARGHAKARDIAYATALRKLQAMLDHEETAAPAGACVDRDVFKALVEDGVRFATFTNDGAGRRVAEVDMGLAGKATFRIEASDTTETLVAKVRSQLGHRLVVSAGIECPACCSRAEHEQITIGALDGSTTHRCKCGMTWATKGTPG